jgi:uncharacterized membrane protein
MALKEKNIHRIFFVSLILKSLNALLEIVGGILFLFSRVFSGILVSLIKGELIEDPTDFFASHLAHLIPFLSVHSQLFASFYLISHGVIKIFLIVNLLRNKIWAYPATIGILGLFIVYQLYRIIYSHSIFLIFLTLFDILLVYLTWHEYNLIKKNISF